MAKTGKATVVRVDGQDSRQIRWEAWIWDGDGWTSYGFEPSSKKAEATLDNEGGRGCIMKYEFPSV